MELSEDQIRSFIECWHSDFGDVLTPDQARVEATRLLEFFGALVDAFADPPASVTESDEGRQQ
jgi:hypothetical protein